MLDALPLGGQQLDQLGAAVGLAGPEDLAESGAEVPGVMPLEDVDGSPALLRVVGARGVSAAGFWELTARDRAPRTAAGVVRRR